MDEAFWANVVKRWSEASDNVLKLKEELTRLQSEVGSSITVMELLRSNHDLFSAFYIVTHRRTRPRDTVSHSSQRAILREMRTLYQTTVVKILQTSYQALRLVSVGLKKSTAGCNKRSDPDVLSNFSTFS